MSTDHNPNQCPSCSIGVLRTEEKRSTRQQEIVENGNTRVVDRVVVEKVWSCSKCAYQANMLLD